jgi:alpha-galactosidase
VDRRRALVYEHGWQSWSPSGWYRVHDRPPRSMPHRKVMNHRPESQISDDVFWGEGLLAVDPGDGGPVHVFAAVDAGRTVCPIRARGAGDRLVVAAAGQVDHIVDSGRGQPGSALGRWADKFASAVGVGPLQRAPTIWCSWYHYFTDVTATDVVENIAAIDDLRLDVDVVQVDDGYQAEIGDWLVPSERFGSLPDTVARIRDGGRRAGVWTAPFLVGERSRLAREHSDWLVGGASAGVNWGQELGVLDVTHPGAAAYLTNVFGEFRRLGVDFFKIDFLYAGAMEGERAEREVIGVEAYRRGLRLIREAIGPQSFLLGCGAPILPSVGLVDGMRIGPDISHHYEPPDGDLTAPSQRGAAHNCRSRAWQHGRFWVNDPDCLITAPSVERREEWARIVERYGGMRGTSDRLAKLDAWGLETTRRLITHVPSAPFEDSAL